MLWLAARLSFTVDQPNGVASIINSTKWISVHTMEVASGASRVAHPAESGCGAAVFRAQRSFWCGRARAGRRSLGSTRSDGGRLIGMRRFRRVARRLQRSRSRHTLMRLGRLAVVYRGGARWTLAAVVAVVAAAGVGWLLAGLVTGGVAATGVIAVWVATTIRIGRMVAGRGGPPGSGPASGVREPRRPLPKSPAGVAEQPVPSA